MAPWPPKVDETAMTLKNLRYKRQHIHSGVARICCEEGQRLKLCHAALTADFTARYSSCSMTNGFVTNAVLIERAVSCWHLHQLISQTTQYLDSWLSDLEVERGGGTGARAPLDFQIWEPTIQVLCPSAHSWRRHCISITKTDTNKKSQAAYHLRRLSVSSNHRNRPNSTFYLFGSSCQRLTAISVRHIVSPMGDTFLLVWPKPRCVFLPFICREDMHQLCWVVGLSKV